MALAGPENAMAWSQFQLRGGWWKTLPLLLGYIGIVGFIIVVTVQFNPKQRGAILMGWTSGLMAVQAAWLIFFGCTRVTAAIRMDISTRMLESHRLMPMPPSHAIFGYIVGATSQAVLLFGCTFLIGVFTSSPAGVSLDRWTASSLMLLMFSIFLWCAGALVGFLPRGSGVIVWIIVASPILGGEGVLLALLPGISLVLGPLVSRSFLQMGAGWSLEWSHAMALAGQVIFGTICFIGAIRKYRRVDGAVFGRALGLALLVGWVAVSFIGIMDWRELKPGWVRNRVYEQTQILASMIVALVIALIPILAAARVSAARWLRTDFPEGERPRRFPGILIVAIASALIVALALAPDVVIGGLRLMILQSVAVVTCALLGVYLLSRWCYRYTSRITWPLGIWIFVFWLSPLIADMVRYAFSTDEVAPALTDISSLGTAGALASIWTRDGGFPRYAFITHAIIALLPLLLSAVTVRPTPNKSGVVPMSE